jgi:hypothetical protein
MLSDGKEHVRHVESSAVTAQARLTELVYELLDAHADTVSLVSEVGSHAGWDAHLDYLRDLQRVGREVLARAL